MNKRTQVGVRTSLGSLLWMIITLECVYLASLWMRDTVRQDREVQSSFVYESVKHNEDYREKEDE